MNDKVREFRTFSFKESDYAPTAFFAAFLIGALLIGISKSWQWPVWLVVAIPIVVITGYGLLSYFLPRLAIREDQLGDNIYYLGFLLTLVSLTMTLIQYRSDSDNDYIISNFGVALAATIWGILCRSILSQMRKDIVGVERELQKSLSEAGFKLRGQIGAVSEDFASLSRQITQITEDYSRDLVSSHKSLASGLVGVIDEQTASLQSSSESSAEKLAQSAQGSVTTLKEVAQETSNSLKETTHTVRESIGGVGKNLVEYLQIHAESLKQTQENEFKARQALTIDLDATLKGLRDTVAQVNANAITSDQILRFTKAFEVVASEMTGAINNLLTQAVEGDAQISELTRALSESISSQQEKLRDVAQQVENAVETAETAETAATLAVESAASSGEGLERLRSTVDAITEQRDTSNDSDQNDRPIADASASNLKPYVPIDLDDKDEEP